MPLSGDLDFADLNQRHAVGRACGEAAGDGFADVCESFAFRFALGDAAGDGGALGDDHAGFVAFQRDEELHYSILAGLGSRSVVVAGLEKVDAFVGHAVDEPVFLGDATGPASGEAVAEGFGLAESPEWIAHHGFDEVQDAEGGVAVGPDPGLKIFAELGLKDSEAVRWLSHVCWGHRVRHPQLRGEVPRRRRVFLCLAPRDGVPSGGGGRWPENGADGRFP